MCYQNRLSSIKSLYINNSSSDWSLVRYITALNSCLCSYVSEEPTDMQLTHIRWPN